MDRVANTSSSSVCIQKKIQPERVLFLASRTRTERRDGNDSTRLPINRMAVSLSLVLTTTMIERR